MKIINCEEIARDIKENIKKEVSKLDKKPCLAVIQVGNNSASASYIKGKKNDCEEVGIKFRHFHFVENVDEEILIASIDYLNQSSDITGIIVQLPLPEHINEKKVTNMIAREKDVDGFTKDSIFKPCTPLGILEVLNRTIPDMTGMNAVVIGRSDIVGKPIAEYLNQSNCTVTVCHSHTKDLRYYTKNADIIIVAVGKKRLLNPYTDAKERAVIIDVGINRNKDGKLCGDVDTVTSASELSNMNISITPVPKGIGLLTRAMLLSNTLQGYKLYCKDITNINSEQTNE